MFDLGFLLNPPTGLAIPVILGLSFLLGLLHGGTPDEHTWPITFSYSIGTYSTRGGAKAGLIFSTGFTIQRAILTSLGFLGLAAVYEKYNLDGPVYVAVGVVMLLAGWYLLQGSDMHLPLDHVLERLLGPFLGDHGHHRSRVERRATPESGARPIPLKMAMVHGFVAGWGVGGFAAILIFVLAPQMPNVGWAALVGVMFGLGTLVMQVLTGALFALLARRRGLAPEQIQRLGHDTASRTLYWGGLTFAVAGLVITLIPWLNTYVLPTGNPIPNLNAIGYPTVLIIVVVGLIGGGTLYRNYHRLIQEPRRPETESAPVESTP
jgi:predicted membrane protein